MSITFEKKHTTAAIGAIGALVSAMAVYKLLPKAAGVKETEGDADTVSTDVSSTPPELTEGEKKARDEARAAAHKRLREKCMVKKSSS